MADELGGVSLPCYTQNRPLTRGSPGGEKMDAKKNSEEKEWVCTKVIDTVGVRPRQIERDMRCKRP